MTTAVDTNALIAILYDDSYADSSERALREAYHDGQVVVPPVVYAELAADGSFANMAELDQFLESFGIQLVTSSREALFLAGERFRRYVGRRPDGLQCPSCGATRTVVCETCGEDLTPRQHIAADFLIGGHAMVNAHALVSFDSSFYGSYFPSLTVLPD